MSQYHVVMQICFIFIVAAGISYALTPWVKQFAIRIGAIDVPKDNRRMHKKPIPRLGGLAIFLAFLSTVLLFTHVGWMNWQLLMVLLGAMIIVILGIFDDVMALDAKLKFTVQLIAAGIPVIFGGLRIEMFSNFLPFSHNPYVHLGIFSIPITMLWIVGITNAVNLIDGLDGLAVGISSIASLNMLAVGLLIGEFPVTVVMSALTGACVGFMPYNLHPAKIFMGDTGSTFLGFMLATMSVMGMFKFYAVISFAVPFLILGLPIFDTTVAIIRRILSGRSPMSPDRGHVHHRLIDMGLSQKQSVAILYIISGTLGLAAVVLTTRGELRAIVLLLAILVAMGLGVKILTQLEKRKIKVSKDEKNEKD